jgi:uncharacterized OB-fold protein
MTLRTFTDDGGTTHVRLTRCPVCGESLTPCEVKGHIANHAAEDFGLSPVGERSDQPGCSICAACGDLCDPAEETCPGCGQPLDLDAPGTRPAIATDGGR